MLPIFYPLISWPAWPLKDWSVISYKLPNDIGFKHPKVPQLTKNIRFKWKLKNPNKQAPNVVIPKLDAPKKQKVI